MNHFCHYGCTRQLDGDTGYCSKDHAELDRRYLHGGVGGSVSWTEIEGIRQALAKWDTAREEVAQ